MSQCKDKMQLRRLFLLSKCMGIFKWRPQKNHKDVKCTWKDRLGKKIWKIPERMQLNNKGGVLYTSWTLSGKKKSLPIYISLQQSNLTKVTEYSVVSQTNLFCPNCQSELELSIFCPKFYSWILPFKQAWHTSLKLSLKWITSNPTPLVYIFVEVYLKYKVYNTT